MKIGNVELKHGIFLAPMAGVTDIASRKIYKKYGVEYMTTEMVSAAAMHYGDKKTYEIAKLSNEEFGRGLFDKPGEYHTAAHNDHVLWNFY